MTQRNNRLKEEVAEIVKAILVADKKSLTTGLPIVELENEYKAQDGTRIPYRTLGYASLLDFLESLQRKGEIIIKKRGSIHVVFLCIDEKTAHVSALVARQMESTRRHSRGGRRNSSRSYPRVLYQPPRLDSKTLADVLKLIKNSPCGIHISQIIEYLHDRNNFTVDESKLLRQLNDGYHDIIVTHGVIHPIIKQQSTPQNSPPKINFTNRYAGEKNPTSTIRSAGLSDEENDNEDFEYVTKSDNAQILPSDNGNNFHEESQPDPFFGNDSANAACGKNDNCLVDDDSDIGIIVNDRTRFRLKKLIRKHPNGIWCAELPEFYHQEYCIPLNYEEMGFLNVSDFAAHLSDIFHCVRLQETGDFKLFDAKCPKPDVKQNPRPGQLTLAALHDIYNTYQDKVEAVPVLLSSTSSQRLVPEGVMTIGETVAQICVTELFRDNTSHIDVIVVEIMTPTFFWIQLLKKTPKFDRFMKDLHEFYSEHAQNYIMPIVVMERGVNCACIYDGKWHRGVIKTVKPNSTVTVLFYDYGTVLTYAPENIHFLHRSFSSLPAQAIPCGLYNVKPVSSKQWPYSVCQVFVEKVMDVPMVAMLGSIDADNNSMLIALTNTEEPVDFHISDWMINSGFAVYGKMVCIRPPNYPFRHYLKCKYGKISHRIKNISNSKEIVSYDKNSTVLQALLPTSSEAIVNFSFYKTLLKLRRKFAKNGLEMTDKSSSRDSTAPREESRIFHDETSQPVVKTINPVIMQDNATNKTMVSHNVQQISPSLNENYGTNLLPKLCRSQANKMAALIVSSSESDFNENKSMNSASSSSASVNLPIRKDINVQSVLEIQGNPEISLVPKKFVKNAKLVESNRFKLIKACTKPNETSSDEQKTTKSSLPVPLHLKTEIPERKNTSSEFHEIYNVLGGHGLMEPIDWNELRNGRKREDDAYDLQKKWLLPTASTPLGQYSILRHSSAFDNFQKPIQQSSCSNIQFESHSEAIIKLNFKKCEKTIDFEKFAPEKYDQKTEKLKNKMTRKISYQNIGNHKEKSLALLQSSEKAENSKETLSKPDAKISPIISTSVVQNSLSKNGTSKIPPKRRAFLNRVREGITNKNVVSNVDDFYTGGSDRLETIAYNEFLKLNSPKKKESSKEDTLKIDKKTPVKRRESVKKAFFNIINSILPPPSQRDSLCVPEGNVMQQAELSPNSRLILKSVNKDVINTQLRLFIPDDVAEILEIDDSASISSSSTDFERNKCTVEYRRIGKPIPFLKSPSSSCMNSDDIESECSSVANDSHHDLDSTNNVSSIMTENGRKSAEKLLKSADTSTTASQTSPKSTFGDDDRIKYHVNVSESNADEEKARSLKIEKIGTDEVRKRDFDAESCFIKHFESRAITSENFLSKSADFHEDKRDDCSELSEDERKRIQESNETVCNDNGKNRKDSHVNVDSPCQFFNSDDDNKLTKERMIVKTRVSLTDCVCDDSEKFLAPEEHKTPNAWIQSSSLKPNESLITYFRKFSSSCKDSSDKSDLDSDDLSFPQNSNENVTTQLEKSTNDNHSSKLEDLANEINASVDETSRKSLDFVDKHSRFYSDCTSEKLSKESANQNDKQSVNCENLEKAETSICLPKNNKSSSVKLANEDTNVLYFDDTCVVSDDSEWDFLPYCASLPRDFDDDHQLINCNSYDKIDEPTELKQAVTRKESNSDNSCADDFNTDQQKDALTDDVIDNIHDDFINENENGDSDNNSISINESLENNSNAAKNGENSTVGDQTSHSILSEVQKLNISATTNAFTHINSTGSSSSSSNFNNESYMKPLMNAFKHYL